MGKRPRFTSSGYRVCRSTSYALSKRSRSFTDAAKEMAAASTKKPFIRFFGELRPISLDDAARIGGTVEIVWL